MSFLYGDSTPSQLESNVLEHLRDAIDCAVVLLQADDRIAIGRASIATLREDEEAELSRIDLFIQGVETGMRNAAAALPEDSPAARCATRIHELVEEEKRSFRDAVRAKVKKAIAAIDADEASLRETCTAALATLLSGQAPPGSSSLLRLELAEGGAKYDAATIGTAPYGLAWTFELWIPEDSVFSTAVRVEKLGVTFELTSPQLTGWISKEVKVKPQRLDRFVVKSLAIGGSTPEDRDRVEMKLRTDLGADTGFDVELDVAQKSVKRATRVGPTDDASCGPFEVNAEDVPRLVDLAEKLRARAVELERRRMMAAEVDGALFRDQPVFAEIVKRVIANLAPIVREISDRSLTPNELVLRRLLANDRREELFLTKASLRDKYAALPEPMRELFAPLALDPTPPLPLSATVSNRPDPIVDVATPPPRVDLGVSRPRPPQVTTPGVAPDSPLDTESV